MLAAVLYGLLLGMGEQLESQPRFLRFFPFLIALPYLANTTGWLLTEVGRVPWIVFGLMRLEEGISTVVSSGLVLTSLVVFTLVYAALIAATIYLMVKYARADSPSLVEFDIEAQPVVSLVGD